MSTERRLKITPGTVYTTVQDPAFPNWEVRLREDDMRITATMGIDCSQEEECANAALYADAHNTANECDMLPSELLAKLREAEKAIDTAHRVMLYRDWNQGYEPSLEREAFEAVNRIRNPHHYITKP